MGQVTRSSRRRRAGVALVALLALGACSSGDDEASDAPDDSIATTNTTQAPDRPDVPVAAVEGPIDGEPANAMPEDLAAEHGYVEEEYFVSGEASAYVPVGDLAEDGSWTVEPGETAPYTTRVVVRSPADPEDFSGTVVIEWFNVTAGVDADPDFGLLHPTLSDEGVAYIGVSAQQTGVGGGGGAALPIPGVEEGELLPLIESDPERYGSLSHPGDAYSYDIYAQVAAAARQGDLLDVAPEHVLAMGESQSAFHMVSFINAVQPVTEAYDGFLVHSRGAGGSPLTGAEAAQERASCTSAPTSTCPSCSSRPRPT